MIPIKPPTSAKYFPTCEVQKIAISNVKSSDALTRFRSKRAMSQHYTSTVMNTYACVMVAVE